MAELENNEPANQTPEDGAQETANQTAEDSAQQTATESQDGADKESEGLKAAAVAEKKKRQEAEAQLQAAQQTVQTVQQQNMLLQQSQQPQQPKTTYEQAVMEAGLQDESYLNQEQQAQIFARKDQLDNQKFQQQQAMAQNNQFAITHDDYAEAVGTTDPMTGAFIPSQELNELLTKKPYLRQVANSSAQAAYELVVQERTLNEYSQQQTVANEQNVRQKVDAQTQPMSPAASGGGGTSGKSFSNAQEVRDMEARIAAGEFD